MGRVEPAKWEDDVFRARRTEGEHAGSTLCPACAAQAWIPVKRYRFDREAAGLNDYQRLRFEVLFELWYPDSEYVELAAVACTACGFVTYVPRPTEADIDAKYEFLQQHERNVGGSSSTRSGRNLDRDRAVRTLRALQGRLPERGRVLDFGGGDGKLLAPFVEAGHECFLVDYNRHPLPGITRLGDTLEDLAEGARFDAVVCSHVLEHLADPMTALRRIAQNHLSREGVVYVEVPSEVSRRGIPISRDPVTHINFFTRQSLEWLLRRAGLGDVRVRERAGSYGANRKPVLVATGAPADRAPAETRRLLDPGLMRRAVGAVRSNRFRLAR